MDSYIQILREHQFLGITLDQYIIALLAILGGFVLKWVLVSAITHAERRAESTKTAFDDLILNALAKPVGWTCALAGLWAAFVYLPLPEEPVDIDRFVRSMLQAVSVVIAVWFLLRLTNGMTEYMTRKASETESRLDDQLVPIVRNTAKTFFIVIGVVIIAQDLGYSVTSLLAGLGLGGMALALASKDTLSNLFGSIVIFIDRPFHVGDWIEMGEIEGTVEEVGLRVTRVRTFANSLITLPNSQLTTTSINNWSRMKKRRIMMTVGLTYDTTPQQMQQAVEKVREIIREDDNIHNDFFLVNFHEFGAYSLDIFIYCFTVTTVWGEYLQARQELLLKIMAAVEEMGLEFAFPTQTIQMAKPEKPLPGEPEAMQRQKPL